MPTHLVLSVTFLNGTFHGRRDAGEPEWPPSPLRLYQSLVAATAAELDGATLASLDWLARQPPPQIVAPPHRQTQGYCLSVPNNALDKVGAAWSRGVTFGTNDNNPATHRTMKTVQPVQVGDEAPVTYLWELDDDDRAAREHAERVTRLARRIFTLGWGADFVAAHGQLLSDSPSAAGECWRPRPSGDDFLRVPNLHTLAALRQRHTMFLNRVVGDGFIPVAPLPGHAFARISYRPDSAAAPSNTVAFKFLPLDSNSSAMRPFNARQAAVVAGMLRHAAGEAAKRSQLSSEQIAAILGHAEAPGEQHRPVGLARISYLPLPTIEPRQSGLVVSTARRALLAIHPQADPRILEWARVALAGSPLMDEHTGKLQAILAPLIGSDSVTSRYTRKASTWSTVTPVILPGHDDGKTSKTRSLIRKAIIQAGFPESLARTADIDWRGVGYSSGVDLPSRYFVPSHLQRYTRLHVRITWLDPQTKTPIPLPGPIALGGGRFCGLGLFAAIP
jgi:CRISPR-associated protein Csb2